MTNRNENGVGFAHYATHEKDSESEGAIISADLNLDIFKSQLLKALELQHQQEVSPAQEVVVDQINKFLRDIEKANSFNDFLANLTPSLGNIAIPNTDAEKRGIGFNIEKPKQTVEISVK